MPSCNLISGRRFKERWRGMFSTRKAVLIKLPLFILCTICLAALVVFFLVHRSFSRAALKTGLEEAISGQAEIGAFHSRYFPPGCVAEGVSLRQGSQPGPPLIVVAKLSIRSTLAGLISGRRVSMRADGMRVSVPASGSREPIKLSSHSNVRIIEFTAENSVLEIGRSDKLPLRFLVHEKSQWQLIGATDLQHRIFSGELYDSDV